MTKASDAATLAFYAKEAAAYGARSDNVGVSSSLTAFIAKLPRHAAVVDLGCGTGRDTRALIEGGFTVTAIDGSAEMAREAEKRTGASVRVLLFEDLDYTDAFDGVWANASLLHVPRAGLPNVLARVRQALKPGGLLHASFKSGGKQGRDGLGRYYNYLDRDELEALLRDAGRWSTLEFAENRGKGFDGVEVGFVSVWARKTTAD